jgi:hypothetical protein
MFDEGYETVTMLKFQLGHMHMEITLATDIEETVIVTGFRFYNLDIHSVTKTVRSVVYGDLVKYITFYGCVPRNHLFYQPRLSQFFGNSDIVNEENMKITTHTLFYDALRKWAKFSPLPASVYLELYVFFLSVFEIGTRARIERMVREHYVNYEIDVPVSVHKAYILERAMVKSKLIREE